VFLLVSGKEKRSGEGVWSMARIMVNGDRSSTTSLRSSMYETVEENGRTYHK